LILIASDPFNPDPFKTLILIASDPFNRIRVSLHQAVSVKLETIKNPVTKTAANSFDGSISMPGS